MDDVTFEELLESVQEAGEIKHGEKKASRIFFVEASSEQIDQKTSRSKKEKGRTPSHRHPLQQLQRRRAYQKRDRQ